MGRIANQSVKTTISAYIGVGIGYINLLFLFPKFLSPDQIGLYKAIQSISMIMIPFAQMGLNQALVKFFAFFNKKPGGKRSFLTLMILASVGSYLIFLLAFTIFREQLAGIFSANAPEVIDYFNLVLVIVLIMTINGILDAYSRSLLKIFAPNFIRDVLMRLATTILILVYAMDWITFDQLIHGLVLVYLTALVSLGLYLVFLGELKFPGSIILPPGATIKKLINFSLFSVVGAGGSIIVLSIDSVMVTSMIGLEEVGIYTIVFFIALVIELPRRAVSQIASPIIAQHFEENKIGMISDFYKKAGLNQLIIGSLLFLGIIGNLDPLFKLIPNGAVFATGKLVVLLIATSRILDMLTSVNSEIISMSRYYRFNVVLLALLALLTIGNNLLLIPKFGINGAAAATLISLLVFNTVKTWFVWYQYRIHPFSKNLGFTLLLFLAACFGIIFLDFGLHPILEIIVRSCLITVVFGAGIILFRLSPEVMTYWDKGLRILHLRK